MDGVLKGHSHRDDAADRLLGKVLSTKKKYAWVGYYTLCFGFIQLPFSVCGAPETLMYVGRPVRACGVPVSKVGGWLIDCSSLLNRERFLTD